MKTSKNFYRRALMLPALMTLCGAVVCEEPVQEQEPGKYALVIGNQNYPRELDISKLINPVNDAESMKCAIEILGWTVAIVRDGALKGPQTKEKPNEIAFAGMLDGLEWLKKQLSGNHDSCGFFFFSGHAVGYPDTIKYPMPDGKKRTFDGIVD